MSACQNALKMLIVTMTSIVILHSSFALNFVIQPTTATMDTAVICLVNVQNNANITQTAKRMNFVKGNSSKTCSYRCSINSKFFQPYRDMYDKMFKEQALCGILYFK